MTRGAGALARAGRKNLAAAFQQHNDRLLWWSDALAVAVAVSLPWSTSATSILVAIWLLAVLPTLDLAELRKDLARAAGALPLLLVALGAAGMLWADTAFAASARSFEPFVKLAFIPLLLFHFRRSDRGAWVLIGFLVSCTVLLAASFLFAAFPKLGGPQMKGHGVPVKDYILQSGEFVLCALGTVYLAVDLFRSGRTAVALTLAVLATAFLLNVFYIATSRTTLVTLPILLLLLAWRLFTWKGAIGILGAGIVVTAIIWTSSPYLRYRVTHLAAEVEAYRTDRQATSAGERLDFWKKSVDFISQAPLIGHGTGSIQPMFARTTAGEAGPWARPSANPHNQIFAVGIQLGLLGVVALVAMWLSHLLLFRQMGIAAWAGLLIVTQNIVSSLFNSHLFDFTPGWIYVFGVGVAGGTVARENIRLATSNSAAGSQTKASQAG